MENSIKNLESEMIKKMGESNNPKSLNNKIVIIEIMTTMNIDRKMIPIKGASLYFTKINEIPSSESYAKKVTSIKNSLDTIISNFNDKSKIKNDKDLNGYKLTESLNKYSLTK